MHTQLCVLSCCARWLSARRPVSQRHEPEFDYLKSLEIEEKINAIRWCRGTMGCKMLLSTNDKTIKLWKIYGKKIKVRAAR